MGVFIEISDDVTPAVLQPPQTFVPQAWVPKDNAAIIGKPEGVVITPVADGAVIKWEDTGNKKIHAKVQVSTDGVNWKTVDRPADQVSNVGLTEPTYVRVIQVVDGVESEPSDPELVLPIDYQSKIDQEAADRTQGDIAAVEAAAADATAKVNAARLELEADVNAANAKADTAMAKLADMTQADEWNNTSIYPQNDMVKSGGRLYRAKQDVPANTPVTNTAYWEDVGAYESIGDALAASIATGSANTSAIGSQATQISGIIAANNDQQNQINQKAGITQLNEVKATADAAAATNTTQATQISGLQASQSTANDNITSINNRVTNAETTINNHTGAINGLASTVSSQGVTLGQKADSSTVTSLTNTVNTQGGTLSALAGAVSSQGVTLADKADSSYVQSIQNTVMEHDGEIASNTSAITGLQGSVAGKADASIVNAALIDLSYLSDGANRLPISASMGSGISGWYLASGPAGSTISWSNGKLGADPANYIPTGVKSILIRKPGVTMASSEDAQVTLIEKFDVEPNEWIIGSVYVNNFRSNSYVFFAFYDSSGTTIAYFPASAVINATNNSSVTIENQVRIDTAAIQVPDNAKTARLVPAMVGTGESDPYCWFWEPVVESAVSGQTKPAPSRLDAPKLLKANIEQTNAIQAELFNSDGSSKKASVTTVALIQGDVDNLEASHTTFVMSGDKMAAIRVGVDGPESAIKMLAESIDLLTGSNTGVSITKNKMDRVFGNAAFYEGDPWGTDSLVVWQGPSSVAKASATKANATYWMDYQGRSGYTGNIITASNVRKATATTNSDTITATIASYAKDTSTNTFVIKSNFAYNSNKTTNTNDGFSEVNYGGQVTIEKSENGGGWTSIGTYSLAGSNVKTGEPGFTAYNSGCYGNTEFQITSTAANVSFRARQSAGTMQAVSGGATTRLITIEATQI